MGKSSYCSVTFNKHAPSSEEDPKLTSSTHQLSHLHYDHCSTLYISPNPFVMPKMNNTRLCLTPLLMTDVDLTLLQTTASKDEMIHFVFPEHILSQPHKCLTRAILAPTNAQINTYNEKILQRVHGQSRHYISADSLLEDRSDNEEDTHAIPYSSVLDYLAHHPPTAIPPSRLNVKVGGMYRIMRNFSIERGLVKNARVVVTDIGVQLISVRLLRNSTVENEDILLPRITFTSHLPSGHTLIRKQFP